MAEERNHDHQNGHAETIMLKNEAGEEKAFELVCTLSVEEKNYAILADADLDEAIAMRIEGDENEDEAMALVPVDDEAEFQAVADAYDPIDPDELGFEG